MSPEFLAEHEAADLRKIVEYLEGHPHDTLIDIVASTGVTMSTVKKLIVGGVLERRTIQRT